MKRNLWENNMSENNSKKKITVIIAALAFAAVSLIAAFVAAPLIKGMTPRGKVSDKASEAYLKLLSDNSVTDSPVGFDNLKSASFAVTTGEDSLETIELGYKKDTVIEMYDTVYYTVSGMTDSEFEDFDGTVRNRCEAIANEKYCSYDIKNENGIYTLTMHFFALDNAQNVNDLITLGIISNYSKRDSDTVSFSDTETSLIRIGFIKR